MKMKKRMQKEAHEWTLEAKDVARVPLKKSSPPPPSSPWPLLRRQAVALLQHISPKNEPSSKIFAAIKPRQSDTVFVFLVADVVVLCHHHNYSFLKQGNFMTNS